MKGERCFLPPHVSLAIQEIAFKRFENIQRNGYLPLMITTMLIELKQQIVGEKVKVFTIHDWIL